MIPNVTLIGDEAKPDGALSKIVHGALGLPLTLDAAPTTAGNELAKHGDIGHFSTNLYIRLGDTIYSVSLTAV